MNIPAYIRESVQQFSSSYYYLPKPLTTTTFSPLKKC